MQIIDYFKSDRQAYWCELIGNNEWRAAKYLAQVLKSGSFHTLMGKGTVYLLTDGERLVSFLTLAQHDCIADDSMQPWIGFVHTAPEYRGHRYVGRLLDHAVRIAGFRGAEKVYLCTDHVGLYEKYGFTYLENRVSIYGEDSRVLIRRPENAPLTVEALNRKNFGPDSLDGFIRHQEVHECWRMHEGQLKLVPTVYTEEWDEAKLRKQAMEILSEVGKGRLAFAVLDGRQIVGYALLGDMLGSRRQYMELVSFHVTEPYRGIGAGRMLFDTACEAAYAAGAEKLYISAHSSRESQAAYHALGCVAAQEADPDHVAAEPYDIQMEYDLRRQKDA